MTGPSRESARLTTALVGPLLPPDVPEGHMIRAWLDTSTGGACWAVRARRVREALAVSTYSCADCEPIRLGWHWSDARF